MKGHLKERSPGNWAIVVDGVDPETGKRKRKWHSFKGTKRKAEEKRAEIVAAVNNGTYVEPNKLRVRDFLIRWCAHVKTTVSPRTHQRYEEIALKNIAPHIGGVVLAKLTTEAVDGLFTKAMQSGRRDGKGGLSPRSVHHMRRVLIQALEQGVIWDLIPRNPAKASTPPKVPKKVMPTYNPGQTADLLEFLAETTIHIPVLMAVMCGLRRGEIAGIQWKHLDLAKRQLSVQQSAEINEKGEVAYKIPKGNKCRTVALSSSTITALRAYRARQAQALLALGIRLDDDTFLVTDAGGQPVRPTWITQEWRDIRKELKLPRIRFHDLRHTHATQMLIAGVHPKIASERLGHSTIAITLDLYSHVIPGLQDDAAEQVDAAIRTAIKPPA